MLKKRLSIIAFIVAIVMGISWMLIRSRIETPDQHAENATKITQIAEKGKSHGSLFSEKGKDSSKDETKKDIKPVDEKEKQATEKNDVKENKETNKEENEEEEESDPKPKFKKQDPSQFDTSLVQTPTEGISTNDSDYASILAEANRHTDSNKKDKYLTDPTPKGMPTPVNPQDVRIDASTANYCTLSIRCDTILNNRKKLRKKKACMVPSNGSIYATKRVVYYKGESVFNVLVRETAKGRIHMDFENTPIYNSAYIKGIHNLYEFDCGSLSGWMYKVNGWFPNYGCSRYLLKPGDKIQWEYTCDLGRDVGCIWMGDKK